MSGKELKEKLKEAGITQAEIARRLGVIPETIAQALTAKDIKTGFLEDLCRVFDKDISFSYGGNLSKTTDELEHSKDTIKHLLEAVEQLQEENSRLKAEIIHLKDPNHNSKESEVYQLWMGYMKLEEKRVDFHNRMQELFKKQKED